MTKARLGGEATGPNPTDRAKSGTKRGLLTDGAGVPLAVVVAPTNRNDCKLAEPTLEERRVLPPAVSQHLCMDKGYDFDSVRTVVEEYCFTHRIRSRGEEALEMERNRKRRARCRVVERAYVSMNQFRRLLIRWERKVANYLAFVQFAYATVVFRHLHLGGAALHPPMARGKGAAYRGRSFRSRFTAPVQGAGRRPRSSSPGSSPTTRATGWRTGGRCSITSRIGASCSSAPGAARNASARDSSRRNRSSAPCGNRYSDRLLGERSLIQARRLQTDGSHP